jgi:hypothetical protein
MRDLEQQSDAELLSTIGQANAILSRRQRERGQEFQRLMVKIDGQYTLTDLRKARASRSPQSQDTQGGDNG